MNLSNVFLAVFNISIAGIVTTALILLFKLIFRNKLSAIWHYYIWLILIVRLIIPMFPQSNVSVFNIVKLPFEDEYNKKTINNDSFHVYENEDLTVKSAKNTNKIINHTDRNINPNVNNNSNTKVTVDKNQKHAHGLLYTLSIIWFLGMIGFLMYAIVFNIYIKVTIKKCNKCDCKETLNILTQCKNKLGVSSKIKPYICEKFSSPCLYGVIKPKLLISNQIINNISLQDKKYIFLHEIMHFKRKDTFINILLIILKGIHWFNPVIWYCFSRIRSDCEISCDEMVLKYLDKEEHAKYGKTIVDMAQICCNKKILYPVLGIVNKKSDTEKRVRRIIMFKKQSTIWLVTTIIITGVIAAFVLTNGVKKGVDSNNVVAEETDENSSINITNKNDMLLEQNFEKLYSSIKEGYSTKDTKENYKDEYNYFITQGLEAFDFLKEQIKEAQNTVDKPNVSQIRKKITAEWLMSDIIKMQCGENVGKIRQENGITAVKNNCIVRTGPGEKFEKWCDIRKDTVIRITGMLSEWYTAKMIVPIKENEYDDLYMQTDQVEFWIRDKDIYTFYDNPVTFSSVNINDAREYTYVIKNNVDRENYPKVGEQSKIYKYPSTDSDTVGFAYKNDMIRLKKDSYNKVIRNGKWVLIEKIPFYYSNNSNIGWIKEEYITEIKEGIQPAQGFIFRNTKIYKKPSKDSIVLNDTHSDIGELKHIPISCIHILDKVDDWFKVSAGVNSFTGWIPVQDVYFTITDEISYKLYNAEPDFNIFISQLKNEILNNPSFILKAEDTQDVLKLNSQQKILLANSINKITDYKIFDGGISDYREAAYPFYRLDFDKYSMVITTENQLLMLMGNDTYYDYGIGRMGMPIRFVTPNIEFIKNIQKLFPPKPNTSKDSFNYLMNAQKLTIDENTKDNEIMQQVQINKCARAIKNAVGKQILKNNVDKDISQKNIYKFWFNDGSTITITYTDKYVKFNEKYYKPLKQPHELMGELMAGYF